MTMKIMWLAVIFLTLVIAVLTWLLFATPAHAPTTDSAPSNSSEQATSSKEAAAVPLHDLVHVTSPTPGQGVGKIFGIVGEAPGAWYFEGSFPIKVIDPQGNTLASSQGKAEGDWTSSGQVPFKSTIKIERNYSGPATFVLMKDNPSGLPENDDSIDFQIVIK